MRKFASKSRKGFTLIELMIVIAIIAILAAILIPNFIRARAQSQLSACEANEKNVATALEMYATDNGGNYPTGSGTALPSGALWSNYIRTNPVCPSNKAAYNYSTNASPPTKYTIMQGGASSAHTILLTNGTTSNQYPQYYSVGGLSI